MPLWQEHSLCAYTLAYLNPRYLVTSPNNTQGAGNVT
jgi:hypothetical protein